MKNKHEKGKKNVEIKSEKKESFIKRNDIFIKLYILFAFMLIFVGIVIGVIFVYMYSGMYITAYKETLQKGGEVIAENVKDYYENGKAVKFLKYMNYMENYEQSEDTEIWVVSREDVDGALTEEFTNADADSLTDEMLEVVNDCYAGEEAYNTSHDRVYGMYILRVAIPIYDENYDNIIGAVMMISMLENKDLGINEGIKIVGVSVVFALFISIIIGVILLRQISRPLQTIDKSIMRIAAGDYSEVETTTKVGQLRRLETALSSLAENLNDAKNQQEELEKQRVDFFANVSHELRTPITIIRGYSETLNDGLITDEKMVREYHERILNECGKMSNLVEDLFLLSKMKNPDFEIDMEPVSLLQVALDVSDDAMVISAEKHISIINEFKVDQELVFGEGWPDPEKEPYLVVGDYKRLCQMFMIIIDNAVKFSNENGIIEFNIEKDSKETEKNNIKVSITDHGVGISEEELPSIFKKFYTSKLRQNEKGTGLGLMIAKNIAGKHQSEIGVQSKKGEGTTFSFTFKECTDTSEFE